MALLMTHSDHPSTFEAGHTQFDSKRYLLRQVVQFVDHCNGTDIQYRLF